jgi:catechol 2,3-dioxygenase-like lactoylglutathione lyase family enzyme
MDLKNCSTAIFVKDIDVSKDFYCNLLELPIELDFGKNVIFKSGFSIWEIQNQHIIPSILGLDKINNSAINRFEFYFETENLHEIFETLNNKNVRFLHEIHEESWGQLTIRFFDPDNHLIEIGESMKQFVSRFYYQGLSVEQVSERTSVPVDEVRRLISKG